MEVIRDNLSTGEQRRGCWLLAVHTGAVAALAGAWIGLMAAFGVAIGLA